MNNIIFKCPICRDEYDNFIDAVSCRYSHPDILDASACIWSKELNAPFHIKAKLADGRIFSYTLLGEELPKDTKKSEEDKWL